MRVGVETVRMPALRGQPILPLGIELNRALAHIGVAVIYPSKLRSIPFDRAKEELNQVVLQYAIVTETALTHAGTQLILFEGEEEHLSFRSATLGFPSCEG